MNKTKIETRPAWRPPGCVHPSLRIGLLTPFAVGPLGEKRKYFERKLQQEKKKRQEKKNIGEEIVIFKRTLENHKREYQTIVPTIHNLALQSKLLKESLDNTEETTHHKIVDLGDEIEEIGDKIRTVEKILREHLAEIHRHYHHQTTKLELSNTWLQQRNLTLNQELLKTETEIREINAFRTLRIHTLNVVEQHRRNLIENEKRQQLKELERVISEGQQEIQKLKDEYEKNIQDTLNYHVNYSVKDPRSRWMEMWELQQRNSEMENALEEHLNNSEFLEGTINKLMFEIRHLKNVRNVSFKRKQIESPRCFPSDDIELDITQHASTTAY